MAAVVKLKDNIFVKIHLQNKDGRHFSFGEIDKGGVFDGYLKGVVETAYPMFQTNFYGKMRKMILAEAKDVEVHDDDHDNDHERLKFPLFTRGIVAERCANIKKGDLLLLEKPFFEVSHPQNGKFHIIGDKNCSDICIWLIKRKSILIVGQGEENECEGIDSGSVVNEADSGHVKSDKGNKDEEDDEDSTMATPTPSNSDDNFTSTSNQETSSDVNRKREFRVRNNAPKSTKSPRVTKSDSSSSESNDIKRSQRITRSQALKKSASSQFQRFTKRTSRSTLREKNVRTEELPQKDNSAFSSAQGEGYLTRSNVNKLPENIARAKESSQESSNSFLSRADRHLTRSTVKKTREITGRAKESLQKSNSSFSSQEDRCLTRSTLKKTTQSGTVTSPPLKRKKMFVLGPKGPPSSRNTSPKLRNTVALEVELKKTTSKLQKSNDEVGRSSVNPHQQKKSNCSKPPKATLTDYETSQENKGNEEEELSDSQPTTPSGTFSSKKQKFFDQTENNPETKNKLQSKCNKLVNCTTAVNKNHTDVEAESLNKDARASSQSNKAEYAGITFVSDDKVIEKHSGDKQAKVVEHVATKSQEQTKGTEGEVIQPSSNELSTLSTSANAPKTSSTSKMPSHSPSYSIPATYTKISDVQLNKMCNLFGVVKFFKPPWKSRGTDMCSVVVLADPSSDQPLECVMFKDVALLPQIRRVGDIVRLHRMNIKKYKDKLQAVSTRGFSAVVFDGDVNAPVTKETARVSTGSFSFDEASKKVVQTLKQWRISRPDYFEEAKILTVSAVEPDEYFDMVCQVRGMSKHSTVDCVALRVLDGTEPQYEIKSSEDDDSYQVIVAADCHGQSPLFDVFLYGDHASLVMNLDVKAGRILMLHNVHSIAIQGGPGASLLDILSPSLELCIHRGSEYGRGLAVLSPDADDAKKLLQKLKQQAPFSPTKKS